MTHFIRYTFIACVSALLFLPFLGHVHLFDWDEINFAECAREMIVTKDYLRAQIDFMPFWEKPPLFIWLQVASMKLFGISEYAARLPDAMAGIVTLMALYYAGKKIVSEKFAAWWVAIYACSWLPQFYFKTGIIDPVFNLFIFLAILQVHYLRFSSHKLVNAVLGGLFLGLAVLTKGPVALLIAFLSLLIYIVVNRGINGYRPAHLICVALVSIIPVALWLSIAALHYGGHWGTWFVTEFLTYQMRLFRTEDADHGGPFYYHFIVLLIGCFPASAFLFQYSGRRITNKSESNDFAKWMWILFWVVLILFSIVKTKIVHYSSLCYYPVTFLAALWVYRLSAEPVKLKTGVAALLATIGSLIAVVLIALPVAGIYKDQLIPVIADPFFAANLQAHVAWHYSECLIGIAYLAGIIAALAYMRRNFRKGMILLCATQIVIVQIAVFHYTPKIEAISQKAAIDFYKNFDGVNVYVQPVGFKSYANLFYTQKQPFTDSNYVHVGTDHLGRISQPSANEQWLITGKLDKPAYFICKIQDTGRLVSLPQMQRLGAENGFVFFMRRQ